jgi:tetratricopeptide (TPR) repeat protein
MNDFFVSYNKADKAWAEWIAWQLEEAGYTTVLQAWDFRPGSNFVLEMQRAAAEAQRTVAVLSPDYINALYTHPEWAAAFAQDPKGEKGTLLPVRVRECDLKGLLPQIIYVDQVGLAEEAAKDALLEGASRERAKPKEAPRFPAKAKRSVTEQPRFPGALPTIWNVPIRRNPNFTGRDEEVRDLSDTLSSSGSTVVTQTVSGLGGIGKTQLVSEYCYKYSPRYDVVWWLHAEEHAELSAQYATLAIALGLANNEETNQILLIDTARTWLGRNSGWLLVFDNAPDAKSIAELIPPTGSGHVLVTSRDPNWRGLGVTKPLGVLREDEAVEFLLKRTGRSEREAAGELAERVGYLPLALEQAGAYVEATGCSLRDYIDMFARHELEMLRAGEPATEYIHSVATTWSLALAEVSAGHPAASTVLKLLAWVGPDEVPTGVLISAGKHLVGDVDLDDKMSLMGVLGALRKYSLAEATGDGVSMHRLVQAVVRGSHEDREATEVVELLLHTLSELFDFHDHDAGNWPLCKRLLPHALKIIEHAQSLGVRGDGLERLCDAVALYFHTFAQPQSALVYAKRALTLAVDANGEVSEAAAYRLVSVASIERALHEHEKTRKSLNKALEIEQALHPPMHKHIARVLNNLGASGADLPSRVDYLTRSLEIYEAIDGPDAPSLITELDNLGVAYHVVDNNPRAKEFHRRAVRIAVEAFGPDDLITGWPSYNLGVVLIEMQELDEAEDLLKRARRIFSRHYGSDHPNMRLAETELRRLATIRKRSK